MKLDAMQKSILKIYGWVFGIGFGYYLFVRLTGWGLPCYFYTTTGYLCSGCGISRMFLSMARLDFPAAFSYNPVVFFLFFLWNTVAVMAFLGKPRFARHPRFLYAVLGITIAALAIFWVLRNII